MKELLQQKREAAGFTQVQMASKLGVTSQYYNLIENGHRRPGPEKAKEVGRILGIDWTLFYDEEAEK